MSLDSNAIYHYRCSLLASLNFTVPLSSIKISGVLSTVGPIPFQRSMKVYYSLSIDRHIIPQWSQWQYKAMTWKYL